MSATMDERSFYGSGKVYGKKLTAVSYPIFTKDNILAKLAELMVPENLMGYVKNGFTYSLETESLDDQSDLGEMKVNIITKEKGKCTFALFNANAETIANWYPTGVTDDVTSADGTVRVAQVGGIGNMDDCQFIIAFHHQDKANGDSIAVCVGKNMKGFDAAWTPGQVTPFACEFEAQPYTKKGRIYMQVDTPVGYPWTDFDDDDDSASVTSISVTTQPTKTSYTVGESLDVTGAKITVTYSDSTTAVVDVTAAMCSGFDSSTAGTKTVTVTYQGKTDTFTVTVS